MPMLVYRRPASVKEAQVFVGAPVQLYWLQTPESPAGWYPGTLATVYWGREEGSGQEKEKRHLYFHIEYEDDSEDLEFDEIFNQAPMIDKTDLIGTWSPDALALLDRLAVSPAKHRSAWEGTADAPPPVSPNKRRRIQHDGPALGQAPSRKQHREAPVARYTEVQCQVAALLATKMPYVVDCPANSFPSHWAPQQSNTELFEVDLGSPEIAELLATIRRQSSMQVVKVHRIQNKKLWKHFAFHYSNMQERWSHEPSLNLVNGGLPQLWHGTSSTEPHQIYASEQGFAFNFSHKGRTWGAGTYYSCKPALATRYHHRLQPSDTAFNNYLAGINRFSGVKQVMAVDVLTGKSKWVHKDHTICSPPKIEDESVGRRLGVSELRYDSVEATHPDSNTPIYITYNSGHGYPKYLITY